MQYISSRGIINKSDFMVSFKKNQVFQAFQHFLISSLRYIYGTGIAFHLLTLTSNKILRKIRNSVGTFSALHCFLNIIGSVGYRLSRDHPVCRVSIPHRSYSYIISMYNKEIDDCLLQPLKDHTEK